MALVARIADVGYEQQVENEDGSTSTVDLSLLGRYFVIAEYLDDTDPTNIILTQNFEFPQTTTVQDAQDTITSFGQRVRDARVRTNELRVFIGATIPLD